MLCIKRKSFANGTVFALKTDSGHLIETTDTFLPTYTKDCISGDNKLHTKHYGSRKERWMIGVSVMSGCPVRCGFCATGNMPTWHNLTAEEIIAQVIYIIERNRQYNPILCDEFKINYTRMGEPFLNIDAVKEAIFAINKLYPNTHHYISTIGIRGSDFTWIQDNITLQVSLHSLDEQSRNNLIPFTKKLSISELGQIRTKSRQKTTVNLTLVQQSDFNIQELVKYFDPKHFFIKLSPINTNAVSDKNNMGNGVIVGDNY